MVHLGEITRRLAAAKPTSTWELRPLKAAAREQPELPFGKPPETWTIKGAPGFCPFCVYFSRLRESTLFTISTKEIS